MLDLLFDFVAVFTGHFNRESGSRTGCGCVAVALAVVATGLLISYLAGR